MLSSALAYENICHVEPRLTFDLPCRSRLTLSVSIQATNADCVRYLSVTLKQLSNLQMKFLEKSLILPQSASMNNSHVATGAHFLYETFLDFFAL